MNMAVKCITYVNWYEFIFTFLQGIYKLFSAL